MKIYIEPLQDPYSEAPHPGHGEKDNLKKLVKLITISEVPGCWTNHTHVYITYTTWTCSGLSNTMLAAVYDIVQYSATDFDAKDYTIQLYLVQFNTMQR